MAFGENSVGWLAHALNRMDFEYDNRFRDLMPKKPLENWHDHCCETFQYHVIGPMLLNAKTTC